MPASDRRVIHLALRDSPDVETYSIGEGPARRVVIAPKQRVHS
jgi:spoIIIJ-associated protein